MANVSQALNQGAQGAVAGSSFGPVGAVAGGVLGTAMGLFGDDPAELARKAQERATKMQKLIDEGYTKEVAETMAPYKDLVDAGKIKESMGTYTDSLTSNNPLDFAVDAKDYTQVATNPLDNLNDFLDPSIKYQQDTARKQVEESAANKGGLFSGAAGQEISNVTGKIAEQGWGDAYNKSRGQVMDTNAVMGANFNQGVTGANLSGNLLGQRNANLGQAYETNRNPLDTLTNVNLGVSDKMYNSRTGVNQQNLGTNMALANQPTAWDNIVSGVNTASQMPWDKWMK